MGTRAIRYARSIYEIVSAFLDRCILPPPYVHTYPIDFSLSPRKVYQPTCETDRDQRFSGFHKLRSLPRNRADNIIIANNIIIVLPFLSSRLILNPYISLFSIRAIRTRVHSSHEESKYPFLQIYSRLPLPWFTFSSGYRGPRRNPTLPLLLHARTNIFLLSISANAYAARFHRTPRAT